MISEELENFNHSQIDHLTVCYGYMQFLAEYKNKPIDKSFDKYVKCIFDELKIALNKIYIYENKIKKQKLPQAIDLKNSS